jgi:hypothetical protein
MGHRVRGLPAASGLLDSCRAIGAAIIGLQAAEHDDFLMFYWINTPFGDRDPLNIIETYYVKKLSLIIF